MPRDDIPLFTRRQDASGGINTRMAGNIISENQFETLTNVDIVVPGERSKRPGSAIVGAQIVTDTTESVTALADFKIQGSTDQLLAYMNGILYKNEDEGTWESIASISSGAFLSGTPGICFGKESGLNPDDIAIICDGTNHAVRLASTGAGQDLGDGNTSPPITDVYCWYNNRFWGLLNDNLYFSDAYDSDYSTAFDRTTNRYRIPVGEERVLLSTRDLGIVVFGKHQVWSLQPTLVPAATDQPVPLFTNLGCVSKKGAVEAGDDIYFFSHDGLHGLKRNMQDKLQLGTVQPLSFALKDEFEAIDFDYIDRLKMTYFDNKIFIVVPTGALTFNTWIYYPAYQAFTVMTGVNPYSITTHTIDGEQRLYYGSIGDGKVFRAWTGTHDEVESTSTGASGSLLLEDGTSLLLEDGGEILLEGADTTSQTAISYKEVSRSEDFGQPMKYKEAAEIEVEAGGVDSNTTLNVYVSVDGDDYVKIGDMALPGPITIPVTLPFILRSAKILRTKFHADKVGRFRTLKVKIEDESENSDTVTIYSVNVTCFLEEYEEEQ